VLGPTLVITGTVNAEEDLEVHATIRGTVSAPAHCVHVALDARVDAEVLARDITVAGQASGRLTATEIVDVRKSARVQGHIASPRLVLEEGGIVNARVETRSVDAAVRVAQYRKQR
jgi:cytoskeletal protein CcmA (bactofilin family)